MPSLISSHSTRATRRNAAALVACLFVVALAFGSTHPLHADDTATTTTQSDSTATTSTGGTDTTPTTDGTSGSSAGATDNTTASSTTTTGDASVATGDAAAGADSTTAANTNDTAVTGTTASSTSASSTTEVLPPTNATTTASNDNTATTSSNVGTAATTGDNAAIGGTSATVTTGNAVSTANVLNVVNTNIFNSQGLLSFLNILMGNATVDLRDLFSVLTGGTGSNCSLTNCADGNTSVNVSNTNDATVNNTVSVTATTGGNTATADGSASVSTGNAYASANVVNLVNTNITDSNYLLLTVNGFGGGNGDIVFPGADWFYNLLSGGRSVAADTNVANDNTATVTNAVGAQADSGNNTATGSASTIDTGDAQASANVVNQVNTNVLGDSIKLLFRVPPDWSGSVFGLPQGMTWQQTDNGIELMLSPSGVSAPSGSTDRLSVTSTNTASVANNVSVYALTGANRASSNASGADITTGNAQASANVVNVVNSNILGRNWVLAIFNILGNWTGNISFGQPDLWVGARAIAPSKVVGGTCFTYEVTVNNFGDADATNVDLFGAYDTNAQDIETMQRDVAGRMAYHLGRIAARGSRTITLPACLSNTVSTGSQVDTSFTASGTETDADPANNTDEIGIVTITRTNAGVLRLGPANLAITKTVSADHITASSSVEYTIDVKNTGDPVYNALLVDTIYDANHQPIHEQRWGLDTIKAGEEIIVRYTAFFNGSTTPGTYTNSAFVSGTDRNPDYEHNYGSPVNSPTASATVTIGAPVETATTVATTVATTSAPRMCEPLLTTYIRGGAANDRADVLKLQYFLSAVEHAPGVTLTGVYDPITEAAVRAFQDRYADEVLAPWGVTENTGYVYYTTQQKINELWCSDRNFPLTTAQQAEIIAFKARVDAARAQHTPLPVDAYKQVGVAPIAPKPDTELAVTTQQGIPARVGTPKAPEPADETAAAANAVSSAAASGVWNSIRDHLSGLFSWFTK